MWALRAPCTTFCSIAGYRLMMQALIGGLDIHST